MVTNLHNDRAVLCTDEQYMCTVIKHIHITAAKFALIVVSTAISTVIINKISQSIAITDQSSFS